MKHFLAGMCITAAMLLGWEVGEWMQARFGAVYAFVAWSLAVFWIGVWVNRGGRG